MLWVVISVHTDYGLQSAWSICNASEMQSCVSCYSIKIQCSINQVSRLYVLSSIALPTSFVFKEALGEFAFMGARVVYDEVSECNFPKAMGKASANESFSSLSP